MQLKLALTGIVSYRKVNGQKILQIGVFAPLTGQLV